MQTRGACCIPGHAWVLLAVLFLWGGCTRQKPAPPAVKLTVQFAGCAAVTRGPVCEISPEKRQVQLWIQAEVQPTALRVSSNGRPLSPEQPAQRIEGGWLLPVQLPLDTRDLRLAAGPAGTRASWSLAVVRQWPSPVLDTALALKRARQIKAALTLLPDPGQVPPVARGPLLSLKARLELARGKSARAAELLRQAMPLHRRQGRLSDEVRDGMALSFTLIFSQQYAAARRVLLALSKATLPWDEGRAHVPYFQGLLAQETGDLRAALRHYRAGRLATARLGMTSVNYSLRERSAQVMLEMGRHGEALAQMRALEVSTTSASACVQGNLLNTIAWTRLLCVEAGAAADGAAGEPITLKAHVIGPLEQAREIYKERCTNPMAQLHVELNLSLAEALAGRGTHARRYLARVQGSALSKNPLIAAWIMVARGWLARAEGQTEQALTLYRELDSRARAAFQPSLRWRAQVAIGQLLEARQDHAGALQAYAAAESLLHSRSLKVPLGWGRSGFLGSHERGARLMVDLLLRMGRSAEALDAVRRSRSLALATAHRQDRLTHISREERLRWDQALTRYQRERAALDRQAGSDWSLSMDKLKQARALRDRQYQRTLGALDDALTLLSEQRRSAAELKRRGPSEGELMLAFYPGARPDRWHGFALSRAGLVTARLRLPGSTAPRSAWSAALLEPFRPAIRGATRLTVLAYGPLQSTDLHALPWDSGLLCDHLPVTYSADLPAAPGGHTRVSGRRTALLVADPALNLRQARKESGEVEAALKKSMSLRTLVGPEASKRAVLEALPRVGLFHFAGHSRFSSDSGGQSGLELADGWLSRGDILALSAAPAWVVLAGCETGRGERRARGVSLSIANAFLASGTRAVIATSRPVPDRLARRLGRALYRDVGSPGWRLGSAFHRALKAMRKSHPTSDWTTFRLLSW